MNKLSKLLAIILILSIVSCSTVPIPITQITQMRYQQEVPNLSSWTIPITQHPAQEPQVPKLTQKTIANWIGDGGKGKSITILPPQGIGLAKEEEYLPDYVASELVSNFSNFSDMVLFDRVNNQRQYDELLSGYYSDDDKAGLDLGHLTSTDFMLLGSITRTTTGYALHLTVNRNSNKTTVASYSEIVSIIDLDNLTGVRRASLDLLPKLGVQLTAQAKAELGKAATNDHVSAMTAMAQGINAQRQGTEVAALTYFFQAAAFDASLVEAVNRTNVLSTNISTGNIGANVRNDIAWRSDWVAKLTETETLINEMLRNTNPQRSIWYTKEIQEVESARNYTRETTELRIEAALHTHAIFPVSVQRTVQAVYDGLQTTKRAQAWGLNNWPRQGVTNNNPFNSRWGGMISIAFELINEQNQVIGRQTVEMESRFNFSGTKLEGPGTVFTTVRFTGVNANSITDRLNIRIATINGRTPEEAGVSQIEPIYVQEMQENKKYTIYNGVIRPSSNDRNLGDITIPAKLWSERVISIGNGAFERRGLTKVTLLQGIPAIDNNAFANNQISSVIIPPSVTDIRASAFANNQLSIVTIPSSVTSIGASAFANNRLSNITIPSSVTTIGASAFANNRLITVIISKGVTTIGNKAFADNHWTTQERVKQSDGTYANVTRHNKITAVTIPASVTTIGTGAFFGNEITGVTIPKTVTSISPLAFTGNPLTTLSVAQDNTMYTAKDLFLLSKDETQLISYYGSAGSIFIPYGVTKIGERAISRSQINTVSIPESVTTIEAGAFRQNQMTAVVIPDSARTIGANAFADNELTTITIGENVEVERGAFPGNFVDNYNSNWNFKRAAGTYVRQGNSYYWSRRQ